MNNNYGNLFGNNFGNNNNLFNSNNKLLEETELVKKDKIEKNINIDLDEAIKIECRLRENNLYKKNENQIKELMFKLKVKDFEENSNRLGLDLLLVLDISGSMYGERLEYLKETCYFIIDELELIDRISIICYDTKVDHICNFININGNNKEILKKQILELEDRGSTNIKLAITESFNQLKKRKFKNDVTSIFLLTDGEDTCKNTNEQILEEYKIQNFAFKGEFNETILFHTFGYGHDHDDQLLISLANENKGCYFYIKDVDMIEDCFVECLGPMLSILGKNSKIKIEFKNDIKIEEKLNNNFNLEDNIININTIGEGMNRFYFCKINIPNISNLDTNELLICEYEFTCDSEFKENGKFSKKDIFKINLVDDIKEIGERNDEFETELAKCEMSQNLRIFHDEIKKGNYEQAKNDWDNKLKNLEKNSDIDLNLFLDIKQLDFNDDKMMNNMAYNYSNQNNLVKKDFIIDECSDEIESEYERKRNNNNNLRTNKMKEKLYLKKKKNN